MTDTNTNINDNLGLGAFDQGNPLLKLVMVANGEIRNEPILELEGIILGRSLRWINSISSLLEAATLEGDIERVDVAAIHACSDLIKNLSDISKYIAEK